MDFLMPHSLVIQIILIMSIILIVGIGLIALLVYDKQVKRLSSFEKKSEESKKGNPFLF